MDSHQQGIVRLAWSRQLGLGDHGLSPNSPRQVSIDDDAHSITYIELCGARALVGPNWALSRASDLPDDALRTRSGLLDLARDAPGARSNGPVVLAYASDIGTTIELHDPLISHDLAHVLALERLCAPDDVAEADLTGTRRAPAGSTPRTFTLLSDDRPADSASPVACAAYLEWQGILADVGILTAPEQRRVGNAQVVGRLATNDAIDEGLIPQWRTLTDNSTARRLSARLGYQELGVVNRVELAGGR